MSAALNWTPPKKGSISADGLERDTGGRPTGRRFINWANARPNSRPIDGSAAEYITTRVPDPQPGQPGCITDENGNKLNFRYGLGDPTSAPPAQRLSRELARELDRDNPRDAKLLDAKWMAARLDEALATAALMESALLGLSEHFQRTGDSAASAVVEQVRRFRDLESALTTRKRELKVERGRLREHYRTYGAAPDGDTD
jgi:hypothetical protein